MATYAQPTRRRAHRRPRGLMILAVALLLVLALAGAGYVAYVLWPRWPGTEGPDAPSIPITVGAVTFNVPPAAIRARVQRRPGTQERIDLAFLWPSLQPPGPAGNGAAAATLHDRIFVTVAASEGAMTPMERIRTIYPRYTAKEPEAGPEGLAVLAFLKETPYQDEDLVYDAEMPERFILRCSRDQRQTPGMCLHERRIGAADVTVRFPRPWLDDDWRAVAAGIDRLVEGLRPAKP